MRTGIRTLTVFLALLLLSFAAGLLPAAFADYTEGYLQYVLNDGRVEITGYFGEETETVVPARIAGYPVCVIRTGAFSEAETLTRVTLPDTVTEIREGAFSEGQAVVYTTQDALQTVSFPATYEKPDTAVDTAAGTVVNGMEESSAASEQTVEVETAVEEPDPYSEEIEFDEAQNAPNEEKIKLPVTTSQTPIATTQLPTAITSAVTVSPAPPENNSGGQPDTGRMLLIGIMILVLLVLIGLVLGVRNNRSRGRHMR